MGQQKFADGRKLIGVHEIRGAFDETVAVAELAAELEKTAALNAAFRHVRAEVVKRPLFPDVVGENDFHALRRGVRDLVFYRVDRSIILQIKKRYVVNRLAGSRQEHHQDRQRSRYPPLVEFY